tara:strand:- start:1114 stop:2745 length:1632 start_codon:yes stop_codon:yes gene_type:complete
MSYIKELSGLFGISDSEYDAFAAANPEITKLASLGLSNAMSDYVQPNVPKVGYQGKIPEYTAVRNRMPLSFGGDRRPGESGRQYFTDTFYGERGEDELGPRTFSSVAEATNAANAQAGIPAAGASAQAGIPDSNPVTDAMDESQNNLAAGGLASMNKGYYLGGKTDGMADQVPANIDGVQEARLSDGEFVIPADVVSHLGNGNSDAGAQQLHSMMDGVRQARTGNSEQGKQIDPQQFMPKMARGGLASFNYGGPVQKFNEGSDAPVEASGTTNVGTPVGTESSLSNWAGDYVTDVLGKGKAAAEMGYEAYQGPLTAGESNLQSDVFTDLNNPETIDRGMSDMGTSGFNVKSAVGDDGTSNVTPFMAGYEDNVINQTTADMQRQSQIQALQDRTAQTQSGAFGGSRAALMDAERFGALNRNVGIMAADQRQNAYNTALQQFNTEQDRGIAAQQAGNTYGMDMLNQRLTAGATKQGIAQAGVEADMAQFEEARDYPYKQVQYMHSLLQGMPLQSQTTSYTEPSAFDKLVQGNVALQDLDDMAGKA